MTGPTSCVISNEGTAALLPEQGGYQRKPLDKPLLRGERATGRPEGGWAEAFNLE